MLLSKLCFVIAALFVVAIVGGTTATSVPGPFFVAETCCAGCAYATDCCCPRVSTKPAIHTSVKFGRTSTRYLTKTATKNHVVATKTITVTKTDSITPARLGARNVDNDKDATDETDISKGSRPSFVEPSLNQRNVLLSTSETDSIFTDSSIEEVRAPAIFRRHVCSALCPVAVAKNNGQNSGTPCCSRRKTIIKTVTRARTTVVFKTKTTTVPVTATRSATVLLQVISGRLYIDINGDGVWTSGVDTPLGNLPIAVVSSTARQLNARALNVLAKGKTKPDGEYQINGVPVAPGQIVAIAAQNDTDHPLQQVQADNKGKVNNKELEEPVNKVKASASTTTVKETTSKFTTRTNSATMTQGQETSTIKNLVGTTSFAVAAGASTTVPNGVATTAQPASTVVSTTNLAEVTTSLTEKATTHSATTTASATTSTSATVTKSTHTPGAITSDKLRVFGTYVMSLTSILSFDDDDSLYAWAFSYIVTSNPPISFFNQSSPTLGGTSQFHNIFKLTRDWDTQWRMAYDTDLLGGDAFAIPSGFRSGPNNVQVMAGSVAALSNEGVKFISTIGVNTSLTNPHVPSQPMAWFIRLEGNGTISLAKPFSCNNVTSAKGIALASQGLDTAPGFGIYVALTISGCDVLVTEAGNITGPVGRGWSESNLISVVAKFNEVTGEAEWVRELSTIGAGDVQARSIVVDQNTGTALVTSVLTSDTALNWTGTAYNTLTGDGPNSNWSVTLVTTFSATGTPLNARVFKTNTSTAPGGMDLSIIMRPDRDGNVLLTGNINAANTVYLECGNLVKNNSGSAGVGITVRLSDLSCLSSFMYWNPAALGVLNPQMSYNRDMTRLFGTTNAHDAGTTSLVFNNQSLFIPALLSGKSTMIFELDTNTLELLRYEWIVSTAPSTFSVGPPVSDSMGNLYTAIGYASGSLVLPGINYTTPYPTPDAKVMKHNSTLGFLM